MKSKALLLLLAAAVLALFVASIIRPRLQTGSVTAPINAGVEASNQKPLSRAGSEITSSTKSQPLSRPQPPLQENTLDVQDNWASQPLPPGSNLQVQLEKLARLKGVPLNVLTQQALVQWSNAVQKMSQQMNPPIEFYGKAVDENGMPLSGVNVRFDCVIFPEKHFTTNAVTDAEGGFALGSLTGAILNVRVGKNGYDEVQGSNQNRFIYYSPVGAGFNPDPSSPVNFLLRRKLTQ